MRLFTNAKPPSSAPLHCPFTLQNNDFDFDFPSTPSATAPTMKIERMDDCLDHGLPYPYDSQTESAALSASSSFYMSDFNHSDTPGSFNEGFVEWSLMTPSSSRRPSLEIFGKHGVSMPPSPADYSPSQGCSGSTYILPIRSLDYSTPLSKSALDFDVSSSLNSSAYSDYSDSFQSDAQTTMMTFQQSSPAPQYNCFQSFIDPQTFCPPFNLSTPLQTPCKPLQSAFESYYGDNQLETMHYFISPTPSRAPSPCSSSTKRRRGNKQTSFSPGHPRGNDLSSSFSSSTSSDSSSSAGSQGSTSQSHVAERPKFFCDWPHCRSNPSSSTCTASIVQDGREYPSGIGFRRQEHLKRHMLTHDAPKSLPCLFCREEGKDSKMWTRHRNDNYRAHLKLHVKNADGKKKGTRTTYRPEAALLLQWLEREQVAKKEKSKKRKVDDVAKKEDDEVKEESSDVELNSVDDMIMKEIVKKYWIGGDA